jgi:hypothetical protein
MSRLNWPQIIVTAVVGGIVTVLTGIVVFRFQTREPQLVYSATEAIPLTGQAQVVAIYQVSINNEGKKEVEDVNLFIRVSDANIEESQISADPAIAYSDSVISDTLELQIPLMNPSESVQVSFLASAPSDLPKRPEISLRGKGVTGKEKTATEGRSDLPLSLISALVGLLAALTVFFSPLRRMLTTEEEKDESRHRDDQRKILAYICGLHGLDEEVNRYLSQSQDAFYWSESDRLAQLAIASGEPGKVEKIKSVLKDLLEYAHINDKSRAIVFFNLARLEVLEGDLDEMRSYLDRAREQMPRLIDTRLKIDPVLKESMIAPKDDDSTP